MRVIHCGDAHIGASPHGRTVAEVAEPLMEFAARSIDFDLAIVSGDLLDGRREDPEANTLAAEFAAHQERHGIETVVIGGNHDGDEVVASPRSATLGWLAAIGLEHVHVMLAPEVRLIQTPAGVAAVSTLPYAHQAVLAPGMDAAHLERLEATSTALEEQIARLADESDKHPAVRIFVGHMSVAGSELAKGHMMRFGWDVAVRGPAFDRFDYAALGHIHRQQRVPGTDRAWYAGSLARLKFDDAGVPKGWLEVEAARGEVPIVSARPCRTPEMLILEVPEPWEAAALLDGPVEGSIVRAVLLPAQDGHRAPERAEREARRALLAAGALWAETAAPQADRAELVRLLSGGDVGDSGDPEQELAGWLSTRAGPDQIGPLLAAARTIMAGQSGQQE